MFVCKQPLQQRVQQTGATLLCVFLHCHKTYKINLKSSFFSNRTQQPECCLDYEAAVQLFACTSHSPCSLHCSGPLLPCSKARTGSTPFTLEAFLVKHVQAGLGEWHTKILSFYFHSYLLLKITFKRKSSKKIENYCPLCNLPPFKDSQLPQPREDVCMKMRYEVD